MTFAPGDVVSLKSGGQPMTVISATEQDAECVWIGEEGELFQHSIPSVALEAAEMEEAEEDEEEQEEEEQAEESEDEPLRKSA